MSEWKVMSNFVDGEKVYIVGRHLDVNRPLHSGNVKYFGSYSTDKETCQQIANLLNGRRNNEAAAKRGGWIPVAESLPPAGQYVAVTCQPKRGGQNWNRAYIDPLGHWHGNVSMAPVIAWMPIEPYRKAHGKE